MLAVTVQIEGFDEDGRPSEDMQQEIVAGIVSRIGHEIQQAIRNEVVSAFQVVIKQKLDSEITDYLSKPIQLTNRYGEKDGKPQTLTELIVSSGVSHLTANVNSRGGTPDYNDKGMPRVAYIAQKMAEESVAKELKPLLEEAKTKAKEFIATKVAVALKEAMATAIK